MEKSCERFSFRILVLRILYIYIDCWQRLNAREWKINFFGGLQVGEVFENFERLNVYLEIDDIFLLLDTILCVKLIRKVLFLLLS